MGKERVVFQSEEKQSRANVAAFLRQLADKVEGKQIVLQKGTESVSLDVPGTVTLEVKVEEEDKKGRLEHSLEVELAWFEGEEDGNEGALTLG